MTGGKAVPLKPPLTVVSLLGRTAGVLKAEMKLAQVSGADLVEVRLDRLKAGEIPALSTLHSIPMEYEWVPAIATLRSRAEGGEGPDDPEERLKLLGDALDALPFTYVDLEIARDKGLARKLKESYGRALGSVFSGHLAEGTPIESVQKALEDALALGDVGKVVIPSTVGRALQELIPLAKSFMGRNYVLHTTGPSGALLRVLAGRLRMEWVYCSLDGGAVEPAQIPQGSMHPYLEARDRAGWYAVLGSPIAHSLSPAIHSTFFMAGNHPGIYVPLEVEDEATLKAITRDLPRLGLKGVNVTRPLKEAAARLATRAEPEVRQCGAANTLVFSSDPGSEVTASNTDVTALQRIFEGFRGQGWSGKEMLVAGTGGAARAAVLAGLRGEADVSVTGRRREAAQQLHESFHSPRVHLLGKDELRPFSLVVHATPSGQEGVGALEVPLERALSAGGHLLDLVYAATNPALREMAARTRCHYMTGLRMLVYQAQDSFFKFTGARPLDSVVEGLVERLG